MRRQDINRVVVVTNPVSTRYDAIRSRVDDLQSFFGNQLREVESFPCPSDTTEMLKDQLEGHDVVVTVGGDGTARTAVEALADPKVPAHQATLLPLPGGYRNDLARQLYGAQYLYRPSRLIRESDVVDVLPLQTTFQRGDIRDQRISALYTGLGAMATAANYISSPEFRTKPGYHNSVIRELYGMNILPWVLTHAKSIAVCDDEGVERRLFDATLVNARVVAEYLHPPIDLLDDKAFYAEIKSRSLRDVVPYVVRLAAQPYAKPPVHRMLEPGAEVGFTLRETAHVHIDGDTEVLYAGQHISFGLHTTAFRALCSRAPRASCTTGQLSDRVFPG